MDFRRKAPHPDSETSGVIHTNLRRHFRFDQFIPGQRDEAIANLIALEQDIPEPSRPKRGQHLIALPAKMAAKAALYLAIREAGISRSELARRIGCDVREVRRLLDPMHASKVGRIEKALAAVGQCLAVELRAMP